MQSSQNVAIVKIPFSSRAMAFSNNRLLFLFPWERGFSSGNSGTRLATVVLHPSALHHKQTILGKEIHTLITFVVNVMASNTMDGL